MPPASPFLHETRLRRRTIGHTFMAAATPLAASAGLLAAGFNEHSLVAGSSAGLLSLAVPAYLLSRQAECALLEQTAIPAPPDVEAMTVALSGKAGLAHTPRIFITDSTRLTPGNRFRRWQVGRKAAGIDTIACVVTQGADARIFVGHKTLAALDKDELAAVVAHEIGHILNPVPARADVIQLAPRLTAALAMTGMAGGQWAAAALGGAAWLLTRHFLKHAAHSDEQRADRAAAILHPHASALTSALGKIGAVYGAAAYPKHPTIRQAFGDLAASLYEQLVGYNTHPAHTTRQDYNERYHEEFSRPGRGKPQPVTIRIPFAGLIQPASALSVSSGRSATDRPAPVSDKPRCTHSC